MVRFRMFRINVEQFAIISDTLPANLIINTSLGFLYSVEGHKIATDMTFEFNSSSEKAMLLKLKCEFEIHEDDWNSFIKDDLIIVPKDVLEFFVVHTVGTARGVLHCKTEGTPFNHLILPPMNVTGLVKEDLVIKQE